MQKKQLPFKKKNKKPQRYADVDSLLQRVQEEMPKQGDYLFDYKLATAQQERDKMNPLDFRKKYKINFADLPISKNTLNALIKRKFIKMTEIQRCALPHAICGRDIMGASKTGSGKTLCYVIPVIENLYQKKWTVLDGLGALCILPTRELAIQVFEVMNSILQFQELNIGLIIGGKSFESEQELIHKMNILIATPGRLLQHLEETPGFEASNLQILVIDEADEILNMGFTQTLNAIIQYLPLQRQTLLFSATLSKSVHELGRVSLNNPEYILLHDIKAAQQVQQNSEKGIENSNETNNNTDTQQQQQQQTISNIYETPIKLMQYYMVMPIQDKLNVLFAFLKQHQKSKSLVFFSTCKQVRFVYETFKKLRIGCPVMELHGRQKPKKRMAIFFTFQEKKFAVLFTTNLAARGLDFPFVDWVLQIDCPEDVPTYIHRVGRTARYKADGKGLLFLQPHEEKIIEQIKKKKINIFKIQQNKKKALSITATLQAYCTEDVEIKYLAQRAFISYMRSVYLAVDKEIFDYRQINVNEFAESLGLIQTPIIKFVKQSGEKQQEIDEDVQNIKENDSESEQELSGDQATIQQDASSKSKKLSKLEKLKQKILQKQCKKVLSIEPENQQEQQGVQTDKNIEKKPLDVKRLKLISRVNNDVMSNKFEKLREKKILDDQNIGDEEDQDDDFLVLKTQDKKVDKLDKPKLAVSKRQLKKIKMEGHFEGKNKILYDDSGIIYTVIGNKMTIDDLRLQEYDQNRQTIENQHLDFTSKYSMKLEQHSEKDRRNELERRKEKRKKKKELIKSLKQGSEQFQQIAVFEPEQQEINQDQVSQNSENDE